MPSLLQWCIVVLTTLAWTAATVQTNATTTTIAQTNATASSSTGYLQLRWTNTDVVRVTFAEPLLLRALESFFASAIGKDDATVRVLDVRGEAFNASLNATTAAASPSAFLVLFNTTRYTNKSIDTLARFLETNASVSNYNIGAYSTINSRTIYSEPDAGDPDPIVTINSTSTAGGGTTAPIDLFVATTMRFMWLNATDANKLFAPFAALVPLPAPPPPLSFMVLHVVFRNIPTPRDLPRALIYQARIGIARFLNLSAIADVYAAGPPETSAQSVLLATQRFYLILRGSSSSSGTENAVTLDARARTASLLVFGDAARPVADFAANDGYFATLRPAMFFDFISPLSLAAATAVSFNATTTTGNTAMLDALFAFAFSSITVEQFPAGNPPALAPVTSTTTTPGVSMDALRTKIRKRYRFKYDEAAFTTVTIAAATSNGGTVPTGTTANLSNTSSVCTMPSGYCTFVSWTNALETNRSFWLESIESTQHIAWNVFPSITFFDDGDVAATANTAQLLAPLVLPGSNVMPVWTFSARSEPLHRLELVLNLRSLGDANATALKVELRTDVRSPTDATTIVTSIARNTTASLSPSPVSTSASNVIVGYTSRFRNERELLLSLTLERSLPHTANDTPTQPCEHCTRLLDACEQQRECAALRSCVFREGLDADGVPAAMLLQTSNRTRDVALYFRTCLVLNDTADVRALLLLANAVRCQMQRLCSFRAASYYGASSDNKQLLVWESTDAVQQLQLATVNSSQLAPTAAVNVSMRLGRETLCYVAIQRTSTAETLQDAIARTCRFASYLGHVSVRLNQTSTAPAPSVGTVEIRYKYVVGPLPTLAIVPSILSSSSSSSANATNATSTMNASQPTVQITTLVLPGIRLRLETLGFQSTLPPPPASMTPSMDPCALCSDLALTNCLRDLVCVAFTDCIMRFATPSANVSSTPASTTLGETIVRAFETRAINTSIAFTDAVDACHAVTQVNDVAWRKLVNASACYSRYACPMSLQTLVPSSVGVASRWRLVPEQTLQVLRYQQQRSDEAPVVTAAPPPTTWPLVPLQLVRGSDVVQTDVSAIDAHELTWKLRRLLQFDAIDASVEFDSVDATTSLRSVQWRITYSHWTGRLPRFVADILAPQWTLFTLPPLSSTTATRNELRLELFAVGNTTSTSNRTTATTTG